MGQTPRKGFSPEQLDCGPEVVLAEALEAEYKKQIIQYCPRNPAFLASLVGHILAYPVSGFLKPPVEERELVASIDRALSKFIDSAVELRDLIPVSDHYWTLFHFMEPCLSEEDNDAGLKYFSFVQTVLSQITATPPLKSRANAADEGRPTKDPYAMATVRAICWYLLHEEGEEPNVKATRDGRSKSKAGVLAEVSLSAAGVPLTGQLSSLLKTVIKQDDWRSSHFNPWQLMPLVPRPGGGVG